MKSSLVLSLVAAAVLGGVIYVEESRISALSWQIKTHRENNADLLGKISRLKIDTEDLQRQLKDSKALIEQLQGRLTKGSDSTVESTTSATAAPGTETTENSGAKWMKGIAKMFTDPEMRKTIRAQQTMGIRMMYGDLAKELGIPPQEAEQLFELLVDRQMEMSTAGMKALDGSNPDQAKDKERLAESTKQYEEQIKAILGEEKFAKLKTYEKSIGDRFMLQQFEGQFGAAGAPLEANQKQQLLALMQEERANSPVNLANTTDPSKQMEMLKNQQAVDQFFASQAEYQKRVLDRSRQFLTADQIGALEKVHQQQLEMLKMQIKMSQEMFGLKK
jgi:hypothetical protein